MEMPTKKNNPETESPEEELAQSEPVPAKRGVAATFRDAFRRAKERQQSSSAAAETAKARSELSRDKTKTLFAMVAAIVALLIVFLGLFSSSHEQVQREQAARRGKPSLGRPETGTETRPPGSVTPMLSAEMAGQEPPTDEVTPEDVNNTSRQKIGDSPIASAKPTPGQRSPSRTGTRASDPHTLGNIPFSDPALEAYRQQVIARSASNSPQPAGQGETRMSAPPTPTQPVANRENPLAKSSLVFVTAPRARLQQSGSDPSQAAALTAPASELQLPSGTRLMARLQTAVSSAVKAPVVAVVETHYERDGEIVIPAGSRVIGELQGANRNGIVNIRFNELRMPDGESLKLEAGAMSLTFGPLKGQVTGTNRGKRFLARALTGVGTVAAFSVGHSGGVGLAGPLDNSIFLRERLAQNIGIAGEQELMNLAFTQDIVVTVPGNTRFFVVLHQSSNGVERSSAAPPADAPRGTPADLPSTAELRELMSLRQEIRRLQSSTARASASSSDGR
jgi:type IV secretory pathway VirB10-like protein